MKKTIRISTLKIIWIAALIFLLNYQTKWNVKAIMSNLNRQSKT